MNKKILHIVDSDTAKERVFQLINSSENEQIEVCPTYLSYGILPKNYTKKQLAATAASLQKYNWTDDLYKFVHRDYSVYDKVIVWHGRHAGELLLLYWMADLTKNNLYEIDVADCEEIFHKFIRTSLYRFPVISVKELNLEEMECHNWLSKYLKKVSKERHNQYKSNWSYWRKTPSLLRVCRDNNWVIDSVDEELIVKMMHEIIDSDWFHKIPEYVKLAVLGGIITYDLYVDFGYFGICGRIVNFILRKNKELIDNGLVELYDIIQWKEAYQFDNFERFHKLQKTNESLMTNNYNKI